MDGLNIRGAICFLLLAVFFSLCAYYSHKAAPGSWHAASVDLWNREEWDKLRAIGHNIHSAGKEDVEAFHLAMLASRRLGDAEQEKFFASLLSRSHVLNLGLEQEMGRSYNPPALRKRVGLFRTKIAFTISVLLAGSILYSFKKREPGNVIPAILSAAGIIFILL